MSEVGWPLLPREAFPAPVPAEQTRPAARPNPPVDAGRQLSIFGADTTDSSPADVVGLLFGPGRLERMGGTARVSVEVDSAWRVHVLVAELAGRALEVSWDDQDETPEAERQTPSGTRFAVRTAYSRRLAPLARAWPDAAAQLYLTGPRLRLWVAAAGEPIPGGYLLGLNQHAEHTLIDATLSRAGLAGQVSSDGIHYVIKGRRRLARLAELVADRPPAAPKHLWPAGATE